MTRERIICSKNYLLVKVKLFAYIIVLKITYNYRQLIFRACNPVSSNDIFSAVVFISMIMVQCRGDQSFLI